MPLKTKAEVQAALDVVDSEPGSQAEVESESESQKGAVCIGYEHDGLHYRSKAKRWLNTSQGKNVERTALGLSGVSLLTALGLVITLLIPGMSSGVLIYAMFAMFGATLFFGGIGGTMNEQAAQAEREARQDKAQKELEAKQKAPALPAPAVDKSAESTPAPALSAPATPGLKSILKKPTAAFDQFSSTSSSDSNTWSSSSSRTSSSESSNFSDYGPDGFRRERQPTPGRYNDPSFLSAPPVNSRRGHFYPLNRY